jgi:hypothetical protein
MTQPVHECKKRCENLENIVQTAPRHALAENVGNIIK